MYRSSLFLLFILLVFLCSPGVHGDFEQVDVFKAGELGYKEFRLPVLVVTNKGTLLAICEGGRTGSDFGDRDLVMRRSEDGGRSWSEIKILRDEGRITCANPAAIVNRKTGRILLFSTLNAKRAFVSYSDTDGLIWSTFREITPVFEEFRSEFDWTRCCTGPGLGIELNKGKYKGRYVLPVWICNDDKGKYRSGVIYSDDKGLSWHRGGAERPLI